ncbi:MAG: 2-oxoacid:acceptor oxidoreductase subunit alpha [Planctomycetota bacterium]|jgi:2-oxoglutarate ferredoxin oxidoreductase subunit alpha
MPTELSEKANDISIVLCGQAGMGIQTVEALLTRILKLAGYNIFSTKEYMSRIRGGANSTEIRISSRPVRAFVNRVDILVPLDAGAIMHMEKRVTPATIMLADVAGLGDGFDRKRWNCLDVGFTKIATDLGSRIYSNIVAVGTIAALFGIEDELITNCIKKRFASKSDKIVNENVQAARLGYKIGSELVDAGKISIDIKPNRAVKNHILVSGTEAVGLGAIAGGCNFISSYPMSPSTGVLTFMAKHSADFGLIVEQAEDEIAAINMAIGAWYAGAKGMVTTSGGGFALMAEGISLAGMLETPVVVHLAQRPGPATGLPTRTEQGDLELALYAGHGEFPRIILAPGKVDGAFYLMQKAFDLADKYQVPVIILTDHYFVDSYYNIAGLDLTGQKIEKHIVQTQADYRRYELTQSGISPRGIPGWGKGLVCVDSDEHDQAGHITEDLDLRVKMVDKRLGKLKFLTEEVIEPELWPGENYKNLVICWGSTYNTVKEALMQLGREDTSMLYYKQVYPLHPDTADYLQKADKTVIVESNATSQFGKLIKLGAGVEIDEKILKYNGLSFTVEEVVESLKEILD